jgi:hypothetical protein
MIFISNTITNPRAMMIHPKYTSITNTAMMSTRWPKRNTLKTISPKN